MKAFVQKALGVVLALGLAAATFLFVSFLLAVAIASAIVIGAVLWWRSRQAPPVAADPRAGAVIEGEYRLEEETRSPDAGRR